MDGTIITWDLIKPIIGKEPYCIIQVFVGGMTNSNKIDNVGNGVNCRGPYHHIGTVLIIQGYKR